MAFNAFNSLSIISQTQLHSELLFFFSRERGKKSVFFLCEAYANGKKIVFLTWQINADENKN